MEPTASLFRSKNQPPVSFWSQMNLVCSLLSQFFNMYLCLGLPSVLYSFTFSHQNDMYISSIPQSLQSPRVSFSKWYLMMSANHDVLRFTRSFTLLLPPPPYTEISPSPIYSRTPSASVLWLWVTKFHACSRQHAKLQFLFLDTNGNAANSGLNGMRHFPEFNPL